MRDFVEISQIFLGNLQKNFSKFWKTFGEILKKFCNDWKKLQLRKNFWLILKKCYFLEMSLKLRRNFKNLRKIKKPF